MIHFQHPALLWLLVPIALLGLWLARRGTPSAVTHASTELLRTVSSPRRTRWGRFLPALRWLGAALFVCALARPVVERHNAQIQSSGVDIMLAVDVSGSMQAEDMAGPQGPMSRLDAAKRVVGRFIEDRPNDRIGLVAFAGEPYLASPLTLDHNWVLQNLERLGSDDLRDGTAIGSAIATGARRLDAQDAKSKTLVLLTDGQNNAGKIQPVAAAEAAKALGIKVYTIGVGSTGEALVPITGKDGRRQLVAAAVDVDETSMRKIAATTGGEFFRATDTKSLQHVYSEIDRLEKTTRTIRSYTERDERYADFALPGMFLLLGELGLSATRFRRVPALSLTTRRTTMRFAEPTWLFVGAACVTLLFGLLVRAERLRGRALARLAGSSFRLSSTAVPSRWRRWGRVVVATAAMAAGFVALARPQKGTHWETLARKGTDLLFVVDTSKSMGADDVKPTRLERAKLAIRDLIEKFPNDRIGLVAFAGDAFVQSPMTLDHGALLDTLDALDTSVIAHGGTNIGRAIDVAGAALASEPGQDKVMVLLSDGEDLEGHGVDEAKRAAEAGITIDTLGVGSAAGELVPARDERGRVVGVVRDEAGNPVRSRLDEPGLRAIAEATHGAYRPLGADGRGLEQLYNESLAGLAQVQQTSRTRRVYSEWFALPLGFALFGIVADSLLGLRRNRRRSVTKTARHAIPATVAAAAAALFVFAPGRADASVGSAQKAYAAGKFDEAAKEYEAESLSNPGDAKLAYNAGDAAYRAGNYEAAEAAFDRAAKVADPKVKEHVLYNEGDAHYRAGEAHRNDDPKKTKELWNAAVASYDNALALDPKDADAKFNRDFVKRKLAELDDQKKDEQKQNEGQKDGANKDDKQQGSKGADGKPSGGQGSNDPGQGGANDDANKGAGDKGQNGSKGATPSSQMGKGNTPATPPAGQDPAKNGANPQSSGALSPSGTPPPQSPPGAASAAGAQNPGAERTQGANAGRQRAGAREGDAQGAAGQLSPRDARALLDSLRGEERHAVGSGGQNQQTSDEPTGKDW